MGFELSALLHGDLRGVIEAIGLIGIFTIVFLESGMMIGFFFPGDSLLFTAGFLSSLGYFNVWVLALGSFIAAVLGDSIGYSIGHRFGKRIFNKDDSMVFNKKHLIQAEKFYEKHGGKTIILARFIPVIRAFAPVVAGAGNMHYQTFLSYNIVGGFLWAMGMTFLGYFLGSWLPEDQVDKYLLPIIGAIILVSILPAVYHYIKEKNASK